MKNALQRMLAPAIAIMLVLFIMHASLVEASASGTADDPTQAHSDNLADFLDSIEITGAEINQDGKYVIITGVPYAIRMHFSEQINGIQFDPSHILTYDFPAGFTPQDTSGTFEMTGDGGIVEFHYVIHENQMTVSIDETSPGYQAFVASEHAQFEIHATGIITEEEIHFSSEVTGEFHLDDECEVSVQKVGEYDGDLNRIKFTIRAVSRGNNTNVHIGDIISATALTYDPTSLTVSSNVNDPVQYETDAGEGETFGLTILSMAHDEIVTIEYYADVDLNGVTRLENGGYGTIEQTGNTVKINSEQDWPGDEITVSGKDFQNRISLSTVSKTSSSQTIRDGKTYVTWTVVLNENANISIAGKTVTDEIDASSQQFMRYSGYGLHIEKYQKDGTLAGTGDVAWGTGGLTDSNGGSTWTYIIPTSDAGGKYRYVITYETEVDSDVFLKTTDVYNDVHNEYDSDQGIASVGTTGEEVTANKSASHSIVDAQDRTAETEWEITFTVPATGLNSAVITDTLPGFLDPVGNRWFYDAYKEGSVRVKEGDLLEGEDFSVDAASQDHTVTITFTRDGGEPGLTATGLTRTIHVYLTTAASHDWLLYAESLSRARTHVNNAVVKVNGQDLFVSGQASYNTTELELEKKFENTYATSTDPALPIYVYKIILTGINDDAFDSEDCITITDEYDPGYLAFHETYDTNDGYNVNTPNGHVYGNTQWNKYGMVSRGPYVVDGTSSDGQIVFKLHKDGLPLFGESYYPYYAIYYALQVKDADTLARMKDEALHTDGLKVELENTALNDQFGIDTIVNEYTVHALEKALLGEGFNSETSTYDLRFSIDVNPEGLRIGDEDTITVKDTVSNLSFDYTSIEIQPRLEGDTLDRVGHSIIFTLQNERHYTITYTARLVGLDDVQWNNKADLFGYISEVGAASSNESGGSGSYDNYSMNIKKYAEGNMNEGLAATFEIYEARTKDADGQDIPDPEWTMIGRFTTDETTGVYQIKTVTHEHSSEEQSLRPYSYHDADGNECFGTGESYGWRYRVKETVAPEGYQKTNTQYEFGISDIPSYIAPYNYLNNDTVTIVNKPIGLPVRTVIPGKKILKGKTLEDQEFTFLLRPEEDAEEVWGEGYPGGFDGSLTAQNDEDGNFAFALSFTYDDYTQAVEKGIVDGNQHARFCYVVSEALPEGAEDPFWNGVMYDTSRFLVLVELFIDGDGLKTEISHYPYDGSSVTG